MEEDISNKLLSKGSMFKFVFQDNYNNWFTIGNSIDNDYSLV